MPESLSKSRTIVSLMTLNTFSLPEVYEIYDQQSLIRAEMIESDGGDKGALAAEDEVIYSLNIVTTKVLQINLEISLFKVKIYIFVKKSSWDEKEEGGIWRPCHGTLPLDRYQDDPEALLSFALSTHANDAHAALPMANAATATLANIDVAFVQE